MAKHKLTSPLRLRRAVLLETGSCLRGIFRVLVGTAPREFINRDGLDTSNLLDGLGFDSRGIILAQSRFRQLHREVSGVVIYALFELSSAPQWRCGVGLLLLFA